MPSAIGIPSLAPLAVPLAVIALFWLAALYLTKKFRGRINIRPDSARTGIKIIAAKPIGWQNSLIIVEAEGQRFLVGASRNGLTPIGRLDAPTTVSDSIP